MTTKQIARLVVLAAVVISGVTLLFKIVTGAFSLAENLLSTIIALAVILATVVIVIWMFAYAKNAGKGKK